MDIEDLTDVTDFLYRKGGLEILIEIGSGSATFQQIDDTVLVSSSTISNRLSEATQLDLVEITHRPTDYGTQKRYELTDQGMTVFRWAEQLDLDYNIKERRRLKRTYDTKRESLKEHVQNDEQFYMYYFSKISESSPQHSSRSPEDAVGVDSDEIPSLEERRRRDLLRGQMDDDSGISESVEELLGDQEASEESENPEDPEK